MAIDPPHHWQPLSGPTNWYRLWFPPDWTVTQEEGLTILASSDGESVLTLRAVWNQDAQPVPLDQLVSPDHVFARSREVKQVAAIRGDVESINLEGETQFDQQPAWWKRPFTKDVWRRWRLWGFRQGPIVLMGHLVHAARPDHEMELIATMILRTLQFTASPADPPQVFAERVLALARRKFPLLKCTSGEGFQLKIGESNVNLTNFYRSYIKVPEKFEEIMLPALTTVVQIQEWGSDQSDPPLERVRERIMPMLYPVHVWQERFPNFVGQPWIGGLAVLYVVDESHAYWYVREQLLEQWGVDLEELHTIALANLDAYFEDKPMEMAVAGGEDEPTMVMPTQPDSYNAARLLSERFRGKMREVMGQTFAMGIPSRDFFVAVNLNSAEMLAHVRLRVKSDHHEMDHPLSDELLLISPDGVSAFSG
ncbi:MAG: DUF1444 family protein [Planctomycetaceae bacterium]|nr:DUF1444 family protein [Planctomycetaceae bacterium]